MNDFNFNPLLHYYGKPCLRNHTNENNECARNIKGRYCIMCMRDHHHKPMASLTPEQQEKRREGQRRTSKKAYARNPKQAMAYSRAWQIAHPEQQKAIKDRYEAKRLATKEPNDNK